MQCFMRISAIHGGYGCERVQCLCGQNTEDTSEFGRCSTNPTMFMRLEHSEHLEHQKRKGEKEAMAATFRSKPEDELFALLKVSEREEDQPQKQCSKGESYV